MTLKIIMHRDLYLDNDSCVPDKVVGAYEERYIERVLSSLRAASCEFDFYYVIDVEI